MLIVELWMYKEGNIDIQFTVDLINNHAFWKKTVKLKAWSM